MKINEQNILEKLNKIRSERGIVISPSAKTVSDIYREKVERVAKAAKGRKEKEANTSRFIKIKKESSVVDGICEKNFKTEEWDDRWKQYEEEKRLKGQKEDEKYILTLLKKIKGKEYNSQRKVLIIRKIKEISQYIGINNIFEILDRSHVLNQRLEVEEKFNNILEINSIKKILTIIVYSLKIESFRVMLN